MRAVLRQTEQTHRMIERVKRIAILGSGNLGQLIAYYAVTTGQYQLSGFFDDFQPRDARVGLGRVMGSTKRDDVMRCYQAGQFDELIVGVGYRHFAFRKRLFEVLGSDIPFGKVVHSASYVDPSCRIGHGTVVLPGCTLDRNVIVEDNVVLNVGCVVAHDSAIGAHSFLAPGARIAGMVSVGRCCFLGVGTTVVSRTTLCDYTQTGGGAVVAKSTSKPGVYVGVPSRFLRAIDGPGGQVS